jgi:hypothetical protein
MNGALLCAVCGDVIGVYEPIVVIDRGIARDTSLAKEPLLTAAGQERIVHRACGAEPVVSQHEGAIGQALAA